MNELIVAIIELLKTGVEYSANELVIYTDKPLHQVLAALRAIELNHRIVINKFGVDWRYRLIDLKANTNGIEPENMFPKATISALVDMITTGDSVSSKEVMHKFGVELGYANKLLEHVLKNNKGFKKVITVCNNAGFVTL